MIDYKEMYYELFRATERAIRELEKGQRKCEEMYMDAEDQPNLIVLDKKEDE